MAPHARRACHNSTHGIGESTRDRAALRGHSGTLAQASVAAAPAPVCHPQALNG
jgi:hypothetical protein